ncbi:MAG: hypothetical protein JNL34_12585 [Anaerolineae bacterium]|nr:hypothetical protein [Anaerolineae bacterium]
MTDDLILIQFPTRHALTEALHHLMTLEALHIEGAAVVARAQDGEVTVLEGHIGPDEGGIAGGTLGAALAMLGVVSFGALALPGIGPIIALGAGALAGALVGGLTGRAAGEMIERSFRSGTLAELAVGLEAGHPALVLTLTDPKAALPLIKAELAHYRAELVERVRLHPNP